ncbi:DUF421 domain-containing protein [Priestia endophytica]|uniref:YetF C-terminal domain-containing protein n=1 Tax=Priestia endophytica TaxID=135735 RepID=A0AAX1Q7V9_9BACI|nr:YetF domain-containing protein [Priestia endophytica]RAS75133.1 hypothetical protein A3864_16635 [Priestia endophytica]RAS83116.1 hypothetical protein A3863_26125 [Priestia endophytica]RAS86319.1 hypothetical protein A3863_18395 [Priestia endophytica]
MNFLWQSVILILAGILLLRIAGRKSISQMTLSQTVVMISLGTIIVQPIVEKSMIKAIGGAAVFVLAILVLEYLQLKFNSFEKFLTGKSKTVINNGQLDIKTLEKLRLTADQLEMRLRTQGISKIEGVKTATIEPNGQLGYELQEDAKPLTVGEFKQLMNSYMPSVSQSNTSSTNLNNQLLSKDSSNIFEEINQNNKQNPKYLQ